MTRLLGVLTTRSAIRQFTFPTCAHSDRPQSADHFRQGQPSWQRGLKNRDHGERSFSRPNPSQILQFLFGSAGARRILALRILASWMTRRYSAFSMGLSTFTHQSFELRPSAGELGPSVGLLPWPELAPSPELLPSRDLQALRNLGGLVPKPPREGSMTSCRQ